MATELWANNAYSTLAGAVSNVATTAALAAGTGVLFPTPGAGQFFRMTFTDAATGLLDEIVLVTNVTGDTITMTRAQEGTTALNWLPGDNVANNVTAGALTEFVQQVQEQPARIVTASGAFSMSNADYAVGLNRSTSLAASSTTLPSNAFIGQVFAIEDLNANFNQYPVTVNAPAGQTLANLADVVLNVNRQCAYFRYYGSNIWSFKP